MLFTKIELCKCFADSLVVTGVDFKGFKVAVGDNTHSFAKYYVYLEQDWYMYLSDNMQG